MKLKMKTTAILIAILMISAFAVAIPVFAVEHEEAVDLYNEFDVWVSTHTTIQGAVDAAFADYTIKVDAGIYEELVIIDTSLTLLGAKAGVDARTRTFTGESILDGSGFTPCPQGWAFEILAGVTDVVIDGFEIRNYATATEFGGHSGSAIKAYFSSGESVGTSDITVVNNYMHDLGYNAILVGNEEGFTQSGWLIQYNLIEECGYAGIELTNVIESDVLDNDIVAPTTLFPDVGDAGVGIEIAVRARAGQTITAGTNVLVEGNEITGAFASGSRAGINLLSRTYDSTASATITGVTVRDNTVSANVIVGILAAAESREEGPAAITDLAILDNTVSNFGKGGVVVKKVLSVQIEGNIVSTIDDSAAPNGIQVGYLMDYTLTTGTIKDNQISGCHWSGYNPGTMTYEDDWTGSGILVIAPNSVLTISGNEVQSSDVGLDIEADTGTTIENNDLHDNSYGLVSWNEYPTVNYNDICTNTREGVYRAADGSLGGILNAEYNWWGTTVGSEIATMVSEDVDYAPWLQNTITLTSEATGYTLTTDTVGQGSIAITHPETHDMPIGIYYVSGSHVTLTANPDAGWQFDAWTGVVDTETNPAEIVMEDDYVVTATFVLDVISISVTPPSLEFGPVMMGESSEPGVNELTITNEGNVDVTVSVDVVEDHQFYELYLYLVGTPNALYDDWTGLILETGSINHDLVLDLTTCRDLGLHAGTLVFWAEEA